MDSKKLKSGDHLLMNKEWPEDNPTEIRVLAVGEKAIKLKYEIPGFVTWELHEDMEQYKIVEMLVP